MRSPSAPPEPGNGVGVGRARCCVCVVVSRRGPLWAGLAGLSRAWPGPRKVLVFGFGPRKVLLFGFARLALSLFPFASGGGPSSLG